MTEIKRDPELKSKREAAQKRGEIIGAAAFAVSCGVFAFRPEAAPSAAIAFGALCGLLGWTKGKYIDGESLRPSGYVPESRRRHGERDEDGAVG